MSYLSRVWIYFSVVSIGSVSGGNVLVLMGVPSPSHFIWVRPIVNELAAKGHNVTVFSVNVDPDPPTNVTYIHLENTYNILYGNVNASNDIMKRSMDSPFEAVMSAYKFGTLACIGCTTSQGFKTLLNYPDNFRFDVIIYDCTAGPCILGFLHKFHYPPLISVSAFGIPQFSHLIVGGYKPSSHVPHFSLTYDCRMSFTERTINFLVQSFDSFYRRWVFLRQIRAISESAFGFNLPNIENLERRSQLMLVNSNPLLDHAEVLPQNVIPVGGLQITEPKVLPENIQQFINSSKKGAVLFAMGTNFKSKMLNPERQAMFIQVFAQFPDYHFLWKFDEDNIAIPVPPNVMISKWLPQSDILAHPRVKAFITHCGLLGTFEAAYYGVPVVSIPVYIDQHKNAAKLIRNGVGLVLKLSDLTVETVKETLREVLGNGTFRINARKLSDLLRDQPEKPLDRAIWWIEWVLRHPHEYHSRSPTIDMNVISENNADVVICLIFIPAVILYIMCQLLKCLKAVKKSVVSVESKKVR